MADVRACHGGTSPVSANSSGADEPIRAAAVAAGPVELRLPWELPATFLLDGDDTVAAPFVRPDDAPEPSADLAPDQLAAVAHRSLSARIIAPAGSGKTRVLTERARHLLCDWKIPASALTLVAYNVRAADELRERTPDLVGLQVRTLNALALSVVNRAGRVNTIDERDVRSILGRLVKFPRKASTDPAAAWIEALSLVRLGLNTPEEVEAMIGKDIAGFAEVFPRYRAELAARNAVDFDEQITMAIVTLLRDPTVRAAARRQCRVMLVDEFQDLTPAGMLLVRLLAAPSLSVYAVGDDDQTIYGYAGATPEWLIRFSELFPGSGDHPLTVNYRCPPVVVEATANLLSHNRRRVHKAISAAPNRESSDEALEIVATDDRVGATVAAVEQAIGRGLAPSDIAVLSRVTASIAPVQVALHHVGIATTAPIDPGYVDRTGVRAALAWIAMALEPDNLQPTHIDHTVRRPPRGLSPRVIEWLAECRSVDAIERLANRLKEERDTGKVLDFARDISVVANSASRGAETSELLAAIRGRVGLDQALGALDRSRADAQSTHLDDLDALAGLAALQPDPQLFGTWLREQLAQGGNPNGVVLSSVHRVKGREWPEVVVHDVRLGLLPHRLAEDREEERRIFHVAITRCRQRVTIVADAGLSSPFLAELESPAPPMSPVAPVAATSSPRPVAAAPRGDPGLRDALRLWRKERAAADGVPPYVVFSNVTLDALAELGPTSLAALAQVHGLGPVKIERYGGGILRIVTEHQL